MKRAFLLLCLVPLTLPLTGCGDENYEIPEVDAVESKKQGEQKKKEMEEAMKNMGRPGQGQKP